MDKEAARTSPATCTITPWIMRSEVQVLVNRIHNKFQNKKMSFENLFWAKTSTELFMSFENYGKHCKVSPQSARNWRGKHA